MIGIIEKLVTKGPTTSGVRCMNVLKSDLKFLKSALKSLNSSLKSPRFLQSMKPLYSVESELKHWNPGGKP